MHPATASDVLVASARWAGGRPRLISDDDVEFIITAATTRPEKLGLPFMRWSLRKLTVRTFLLSLSDLRSCR